MPQLAFDRSNGDLYAAAMARPSGSKDLKLAIRVYGAGLSGAATTHIDWSRDADQKPPTPEVV
jgi:hypothetical protein